MTRIVGRARGGADDRPRVEVIGHRGASADLPENTPEAFELAIRQGAHAVELDTHLAADDVPVVRHDLLLEGRATRHMLAAELRAAGVPTLRDCLDAVARAGRAAGTSPWVLVEIKSAPDGHAPCATPDLAVREVARVVAEHGLADRCVLESFDRAVLAAAVDLAPALPRAVLADATTTAAGAAWLGPARERWADPDPVAAARALGAVAVAADHEWLDADLGGRTRAAGLALWAWTVNTSAAAARAVQLGATGLVTDRPAAMLAALDGLDPTTAGGWDRRPARSGLPDQNDRPHQNDRPDQSG